MDWRKRDAVRQLRGELRNGDQVYTVLKKVGSSGRVREFMVLVARRNRIRDISWLVASVCSERYNRERGTVIMPGCGFDAGHDLVYRLQRQLWPRSRSDAPKKLEHCWL